MYEMTLYAKNVSEVETRNEKCKQHFCRKYNA